MIPTTSKRAAPEREGWQPASRETQTKLVSGRCGFRAGVLRLEVQVEVASLRRIGHDLDAREGRARVTRGVVRHGSWVLRSRRRVPWTPERIVC